MDPALDRPLVQTSGNVGAIEVGANVEIRRSLAPLVQTWKNVGTKERISKNVENVGKAIEMAGQ
jgi:hypothetical protein